MHYTSCRFVFFTIELTDVIRLQILPALRKLFATTFETSLLCFTAEKAWHKSALIP